jgi:hypothetical protein
LIIEARAFWSPFFNTGRKLDLLLGSQQWDLHDLPQVTLNGRIRIFTGHPPTSPQIGSEATA